VGRIPEAVVEEEEEEEEGGEVGKGNKGRERRRGGAVSRQERPLDNRRPPRIPWKIPRAQQYRHSSGGPAARKADYDVSPLLYGQRVILIYPSDT
jgi:hypothetical protein